jgi:inosose dehydratase
MTGPRFGNAPVSYGVFGATTHGAVPRDLLRTIADAGYEGCELGPPGFFGSPTQTAEAFNENGLISVGGYVPLHLAGTDAAMVHDLAGMEATCAELLACGGGLAILADEGSPELLGNPARDWLDRSLSLSSDDWDRLAIRVRDAQSQVEQAGLTASFHPHISTFIESPWEIEILLERTDIHLTLDVGHMALAGADPVKCVRDWADRINHVHIKDVRVEVLQAARAQHRADFDIWWADVCVPLGQGDVDIPGVLDALVAVGYQGWLVVEQDRGPTLQHEYPDVAREQAANGVWLRQNWQRASRSESS